MAGVNRAARAGACTAHVAARGSDRAAREVAITYARDRTSRRHLADEMDGGACELLPRAYDQQRAVLAASAPEKQAAARVKPRAAERAVVRSGWRGARGIVVVLHRDGVQPYRLSDTTEPWRPSGCSHRPGAPSPTAASPTQRLPASPAKPTHLHVLSLRPTHACLIAPRAPLSAKPVPALVCNPRHDAERGLQLDLPAAKPAAGQRAERHSRTLANLAACRRSSLHSCWVGRRRRKACRDKVSSLHATRDGREWRDPAVQRR